jgi:hypothetical protein
MKLQFLIIFYSTFGIALLSAQVRHDYIWTLGYGDVGLDPGGNSYGGILMDFNFSPPTFTLQDYPCDRPKACISTPNGQLFAYTDGCEVFNSDHQIMLHGDSLNPGKVYKLFCAQSNYPLWQPVVFLPKPGSDSLYYLFHLRADDLYWRPMNLMYTEIDASGDGGKGAVLSKNNIIITDSLYLGSYVHAVRHGNGRDWWLVCPRLFSYDLYVSLLTPDGVAYKGIQPFDLIKADSTCCISQQAFSTDGSKYFRNSPEGLTIYDFDRCSGTFNVSTYLDWDLLPSAIGGVVTSPNSRLLYITSGGTVQQYDLWASDIAASMQVVGIYDGTLAPYPANFYWMLRGPDGKIYMNTSYDNNVLHVIHHPDSLGTACHFEQHAITLPAFSSVVMPNIPNYRLGALPGLCPVSEATEGKELRALHISPNPATDLIQLPWEGPLESLQLFDALGQQMPSGRFTLSEGRLEVPVGHLPTGMYFLHLRAQGRVWSGRFVKG